MFCHSCCIFLSIPDVVNDLRTVIKQTLPINDWPILGIALGLPVHAVDRLKRENLSISDLQRNMLQYWLETGDASWAVLVNALKSDVVAKVGLAKKIAKEYPSK